MIIEDNRIILSTNNYEKIITTAENIEYVSIEKTEPIEVIISIKGGRVGSELVEGIKLDDVAKQLRNFIDADRINKDEVISSENNGNIILFDVQNVTLLNTIREDSLQFSFFNYWFLYEGKNPAKIKRIISAFDKDKDAIRIRNGNYVDIFKLKDVTYITLNKDEEFTINYHLINNVIVKQKIDNEEMYNNALESVYFRLKS